ncbi:hypothetical protein L596_002640 [Steinernema carpocapsae]|uniref:Apple domain-containing protein n=1 Tax=Steinernema carpocapsae TaxID=34508 RepID=A0A4U8URP6_STECR|nr:hypothetical protein L596_002640 [Steinernema carpocapsae]
MGTRRLLIIACFIAYCSGQQDKPKAFAAPIGVNAIEVDGDVKKFFKIGAARDGIQKAILDEVLPAGDHNNFIDDEIEDPGAYDEEITDVKNENPLFIPRLYRNETAEEKAATATTKTTTTTTPRPTQRPVFRTLAPAIENLVTDIPDIGPPHVEPQVPRTLPRVQPNLLPQQPLPQIPVQRPRPMAPQQPHQFVPPPPPVAPQTLPPRPSQQPFPQQPFPQQPLPSHPLPQQPLPQQPQQPFTHQPLSQIPQQPDQFTTPQTPQTPQTFPTAPVQPPVPQRPQPRPRPPPTTPTRNLPFQPQRPSVPRPQDPTGLRTGVCRQSIFYITAPVHPVDTHLTFTHFAAVVSVDQCARTCHEFNCAIAHYDPATGHCQFNPSTVFSIRDAVPEMARQPLQEQLCVKPTHPHLLHYLPARTTQQEPQHRTLLLDSPICMNQVSIESSRLQMADSNGFIRRPKNKAFQPTVIGRAASTHFNVHGVILRQPQSTAIGLGPFTQRENSFLVKKSAAENEKQQQLVEFSEEKPSVAPVVEEVTSTDAAPEPVSPSEEPAPTEVVVETAESSSAAPSSTTPEESAETEPTTRRPRRKLHRASGVATNIRRIAQINH